MSENQSTPFVQRILDNMWVLLLLGIIVYSISYIAWGWIEIATVQPIPEEIKLELLNNQ